MTEFEKMSNSRQNVQRPQSGSRYKGMRNVYDPAKPVVSVVTVVYNAVDNLEETINSVAGQSYANIEHIIIDGGSTDGTLDVIRKYESKIDYWISEKDNGIYDAMNKGVRAASGDWLNFMNAGDTFYSSNTVKEIIDSIPLDADLVYGHTYYKESDRMTLIETYNIESLWMSMIFSHQSLFVRTDILSLHPFRTDFKISSDFEFIYFCYVNRYTFFDTKKIIAVHTVDGISEKRIIKRMMERWKVVNRYTPSWKVHWFYLTLLLKKIGRLAKVSR